MLISLMAIAQGSIAKLEVNYQTKIIPDSLNRDITHYLDATLLCSENESIYFSRDAENFYNFLYKNVQVSKDNTITLGTLPTYPKVKGTVYKLNDVITASLPVGTYNYTFEEPTLKWELLNETKNILGVECNSAKVITDNGDEFTAWYTTKYPFSDGPFRFKGLPGLIVKIYNKSKTIEIDAIEIKKSEEEIIHFVFGKNFRLKNKDAFKKARKEYFENPNIQYNPNIIIKDSNGNDLSKNRGAQINKINVFLD